VNKDRSNSPHQALRAADAARGILITVVIGVIGYFGLFPTPGPEQGRPFLSRTGLVMLLIGVGLQLAVLVGRRLIGKLEMAWGVDGQLSPMAVHILQLVADGLTVLVFALAVFGGISQAESAL
jgi:hypothetical protein